MLKNTNSQDGQGTQNGTKQKERFTIKFSHNHVWFYQGNLIVCSYAQDEKFYFDHRNNQCVIKWFTRKKITPDISHLTRVESSTIKPGTYYMNGYFEPHGNEGL